MGQEVTGAGILQTCYNLSIRFTRETWTVCVLRVFQLATVTILHKKWLEAPVLERGFGHQVWRGDFVALYGPNAIYCEVSLILVLEPSTTSPLWKFVVLRIFPRILYIEFLPGCSCSCSQRKAYWKTMCLHSSQLISLTSLTGCPELVTWS